MRKTITRWTPACNIVLFWYITGTDFGRKIWPWDRSLFSLNSPTQILDLGGARAKPAFENPGYPRQPAGAPLIATDPRKRLPLGAGKHAAELG